MIETGLLELAPTWSHYAGEYKKAKWFKIGHIVIVQGLVKSSDFTNHRHMATLPVQCRPKQRIIFSLDHNSATFRVDVYEDGRIVYITGNRSYNWISLGGWTLNRKNMHCESCLWIL